MRYETKMLTAADIELAAHLLRQGECVAFPTETVYGLGANALDKRAVAKIYAAKGRPADNPLIVHCHSQAQARELVRDWPQQVQKLADAFWPGPLTVVLPKNPVVPAAVTGGLDTVALRIPDHPIALDLIAAARLPVAAPSANLSGRPSPTRAEHVWQDLAGRIAAIIDGGPTGWGVESTVLDCTRLPFRLLRPGGITLEDLRRLAPVETANSGLHTSGAPLSPGVKYRHYSPSAQAILVTGKRVAENIRRLAACHGQKGKKVAVMACDESRDNYPGVIFLALGSKANLQVAAARIYHLLRQADAMGCDVILIEELPREHLGRAIMDRLQKAAGPNIIET